MRQFRIVHLRSLYSRDRWPPPRPALTIFVLWLPWLLDPVHGPIQKRKHGCSRGLANVAQRLTGLVRLCASSIDDASCYTPVRMSRGPRRPPWENFSKASLAFCSS